MTTQSGAARRRCGVVGDPIEHSLSPALHGVGYAAVGLDWVYGRARVDEGGLAVYVGGLDASWRGLSVTAPLKREAWALCSSVSELGRLAGAVNTLILEEVGTAGRREVHGDNTDVPGAVDALCAAGVQAVSSATILGGGATATSTGLALQRLGASRITLLARDAGRVAETVSVLRSAGDSEVVVAGLDSVVDSGVGGDIVVSTVPATAQTPALVAACAEVPTVFEVLYDPWPTPLASAAVERGQVLVGGLDLLVAQAALQFTAFTGLPAPLDAMRAAGEAELAARAGADS